MTLIESAIDVSIDLKDDKQNNYLVKLKQKLTNEEVYLAVIGLFKRGKSSLINALLRQSILPSGVVLLTSVITRLSYGRRFEAVITFNSGKR